MPKMDVTFRLLVVDMDDLLKSIALKLIMLPPPVVILPVVVVVVAVDKVASKDGGGRGGGIGAAIGTRGGSVGIAVGGGVVVVVGKGNNVVAGRRDCCKGLRIGGTETETGVGVAEVVVVIVAPVEEARIGGVKGDKEDCEVAGTGVDEEEEEASVALDSCIGGRGVGCCFCSPWWCFNNKASTSASLSDPLRGREVDRALRWAGAKA